MKSALLMLALALILTGCTESFADRVAKAKKSGAAHPQIEMSSFETSIVEDAISSRLKDPSSAQFGAMAAALQTDGSVIVCGLVNAKNSFGGYTGNQPYFGTLGENWFVPTSLGENSDPTSKFNPRFVCKENGMSFR